jgi:hypothetical protein
VTFSWLRWQVALIALAILASAETSLRAQVTSKPKPPPWFVAVDPQDIRQLNLSPLALTLWSYLAAESRVTESEGFGLSAAPHFGGAKISRFDRLAVWGAAGAVAAGLGASAPSIQTLRMPPRPALTATLGAAGGIVVGELVWLVLRPDLPIYTKKRDFITVELTAVSVSIEHLSTPIALPDVRIVWVPAIVGRW